jgi:hypothetical protein
VPGAIGSKERKEGIQNNNGLVLKNGVLTPIHNSQYGGVHADLEPSDGSPKLHIPYSGQTTLDMFRIGTRPSYETYTKISELNLGSLMAEKSFK